MKIIDTVREQYVIHLREEAATVLGDRVDEWARIMCISASQLDPAARWADNAVPPLTPKLFFLMEPRLNVQIHIHMVDRTEILKVEEPDLQAELAKFGESIVIHLQYQHDHYDLISGWK